MIALQEITGDACNEILDGVARDAGYSVNFYGAVMGFLKAYGGAGLQEAHFVNKFVNRGVGIELPAPGPIRVVNQVRSAWSDVAKAVERSWTRSSTIFDLCNLMSVHSNWGRGVRGLSFVHFCKYIEG